MRSKPHVTTALRRPICRSRSEPLDRCLRRNSPSCGSTRPGRRTPDDGSPRQDRTQPAGAGAARGRLACSRPASRHQHCPVGQWKIPHLGRNASGRTRNIVAFLTLTAAHCTHLGAGQSAPHPPSRCGLVKLSDQDLATRSTRSRCSGRLVRPNCRSGGAIMDQMDESTREPVEGWHSVQFIGVF